MPQRVFQGDRLGRVGLLGQGLYPARRACGAGPGDEDSAAVGQGAAVPAGEHGDVAGAGIAQLGQRGGSGVEVVGERHVQAAAGREAVRAVEDRRDVAVRPVLRDELNGHARRHRRRYWRIRGGGVTGVVAATEYLRGPGGELLIVGVVDDRDAGRAETADLPEQADDARLAADGVELLGDELRPGTDAGAEAAGRDDDEGGAVVRHRGLLGV